MRQLALCGAALVALVAAPAFAQERMTIVVPFAPGGGIDIFARLMGEEIGKGGTNVVIENRAGAASMIGTEYVARAAPDGATVLISSNSTLISPVLKPGAFDPLRDMTFVCNLAESPQILAVKADAPYRTLADLVAAAKAAPGKLTIASNGPASTQQLVAESFKRAAGIDMTYVPYNGGAPAVNAVIGGQVNAVAANLSEVHGQIAGGALRPLATTAAKRLASLPDLPTAREAGIDFDISSWHGVALPAKAPADVVARVQKRFLDALAAPELREKLATARYTPTGVCGAPVADFIHAQVESIGAIAKAAGIRME